LAGNGVFGEICAPRRAGGAAFSKGNEEGKVGVKIEWLGGVLAAELSRKGVGFWEWSKKLGKK